MKHQQKSPRGTGCGRFLLFSHSHYKVTIQSRTRPRRSSDQYTYDPTRASQVVIGNEVVVPNGQRSRSQPYSPETASIFFALVQHPRKNRSELIIKLQTNKASGRLETSFLNRLGRECRTSGKDILILWTRPQKRDVKPSALKHAFCFRSYL